MIDTGGENMGSLEQFKLNVEEQIERYKSKKEITEQHRKMMIEQLSFVIERIKIYEFEQELNNK